MDAREINRMIADAASHGQNLYADKLLTNLGLEHSARIIRAKTVTGMVKARNPAGDWFRVTYATTFDAR